MESLKLPELGELSSGNFERIEKVDPFNHFATRRSGERARVVGIV